MAKAKEKEQGFEDSLKSLERIVAQLESGELPLERALELFEDGIGLARRCQSQLDDAERKVDILLRERGEIKVIPFEAKADKLASESDQQTLLNAASMRLTASDSSEAPKPATTAVAGLQPATRAADDDGAGFFDDDDSIPF